MSATTRTPPVRLTGPFAVLSVVLFLAWAGPAFASTVCNTDATQCATLSVNKLVSHDGEHWANNTTQQTPKLVRGPSALFLYRIDVTSSSSSVPVTDVVVTESGCDNVELKSGDDNANSQLDAGETWNYFCNHKFDDDGDPNPYPNTVTVDATGSVTGEGASALTATDTEWAQNVDPPKYSFFNIGPAYAIGGETIHWTLVLQNLGKSDLTVDLAGQDCTPVPVDIALPAVGSGTLQTFDCQSTAPPTGVAENRVCSEAVDIFGADFDAYLRYCTRALTPVVQPHLTVSKTVDSAWANWGDTLTYTIAVDNDGDVPLWVAPEDVGCDGFSAPPKELAPSDPVWTITCTHTAGKGDPSQLTNEACASGWVYVETEPGVPPSQPAEGEPHDVHACSSVTTFISSPGVSVTKTVAEATADNGDKLNYKITVRNTSFVNLDVTLIDDGCDEGVPAPFALYAFYTYEYSCTHTWDGDVDGFLAFTNTACAYAYVGEHSPGDEADVASCAQVTTAYDRKPSLDVTKTVDKASVDPNETLQYHVSVKNTGNIPLWVEPRDTGCDGAAIQNTPLAAGASLQFDCTHVFTEADGSKYTNEACADGFEIDGGEGPGAKLASDCASVTTNRATHAITGRVFEDMDADGSRAPDDPAIVSATVYADLDGNASLGSSEPNAQTNESGIYSIAVPLGTYAVRIVTPGGYTCSHPGAGCSHTVNLPLLPAPTQTQLRGRAVDPVDLDFGAWRPGAVSGTVVNDANRDGARQSTETGIEGVSVFADLDLDGTAGANEPTTASGPDGSYVLGGLKPGSYVVRHVVPSGFGCTAPAGCQHSESMRSGGGASNRDFLDAPPPPPEESPEQVVLPERITPGSAALSGKTGCARRAFSARVSGSKIARVVFSLDGKRVRTVSKPAYALRIVPNRLRYGRHTVVARVTFTKVSRTKAKTLRLTFQRCAKRLAAPKFTG